MSVVGQSRSLEIFICMPKTREFPVIRSTSLFSHRNRKSKTDSPVLISSLVFTPETKMPSDSPYSFGSTLPSNFCIVGNML